MVVVVGGCFGGKQARRRVDDQEEDRERQASLLVSAGRMTRPGLEKGAAQGGKGSARGDDEGRSASDRAGDDERHGRGRARRQLHKASSSPRGSCFILCGFALHFWHQGIWVFGYLEVSAKQSTLDFNQVNW